MLSHSFQSFPDSPPVSRIASILIYFHGLANMTAGAKCHEAIFHSNRNNLANEAFYDVNKKKSVSSETMSGFETYKSTHVAGIEVQYSASLELGSCSVVI